MRTARRCAALKIKINIRIKINLFQRQRGANLAILLPRHNEVLRGAPNSPDVRVVEPYYQHTKTRYLRGPYQNSTLESTLRSQNSMIDRCIHTDGRARHLVLLPLRQ